MKKVVVACAVGCLFGCGAKKNVAAEDTSSADAIKTPATVEQAARVLDLSTFPLMDGARSAESRHVANVSYVAPGDPKKALEFHRKAFIAQGWKELPNSTISDESASAMFARDGFVVSLSVQSETGGNLAEILDNLSTVIRERHSMYLKVRALSSEGRMTAIMLTVLPLFAFAMLFLFNANFYLDVSDDPAFMPGFLGLILMYVIGFIWIRKLVDLKV